VFGNAGNAVQNMLQQHMNSESDVMGYVCLKCRKESDAEDKVRCSYCGFRILAKTRTPFKKRVEAK
jgi:DNA-directed RNA polymerase subunit RPC12/RpoP